MVLTTIIDKLLASTDEDHALAAGLDLAHAVRDHIRVLPEASAKLMVSAGAS